MFKLQIVVKRILDIFIGVIGCIVTAFLFLILAPIIYKQSPGSTIFSQQRVGKDGKLFTMYKFRSMCVNAEEQQEFMLNDNMISGKQMFRVEFDSQIIGNRILSDGTKKTGIGQFIRETGLDEFPQFWSVIKGEMSCVGPRPALVSEVEHYEEHHKVRLSVKPGITGLWQVTGRDTITDFEEVVRLDKEYIENWNLWLDLRIMIQTSIIMLKKLLRK